jgi:hypothetical protein
MLSDIPLSRAGSLPQKSISAVLHRISVIRGF